MKKMGMKLGVLTAIVAPVATLVSCNPDEEISNVALVTDAGSVNDKSFNEQGKQALDLINQDLKIKTNNEKDVFTPDGHDAANIEIKYNAALSGGKKVVLAPGFYHVAAIKKFNKNAGQELNFILADGVVDEPNVASITYNTKEPGFLAGILAGIYLKEIGDNNPKVGTFGGGNFPGVTDFMVGFVEGIKYYNESIANPSNGDKIVKFYAFGNDADYTNSGFDSGGGSAKSGAMVVANVDIILPVAGPQVADAIAAAKTRTGGNTKVIGVDTDQKLAYANDKSYILTSILKNLKDSMHAVYQKGASDSNAPSWAKGYGETTKADLTNRMTGIEKSETGNIPSTTKTWKSLYDQVSTAEIKTAAKTIGSVDWATALTKLKAMV